jgi:Big-like domain-containing protein/WD40 repeat protein
MSSRMHFVRFALLAALAAACGSPVETVTPPPPPLTDAAPFVVSNPVANVSGVTVERSVAGSSATDPVTYISLPPGALPGGTRVSIRVERTAAVASAALHDGGLDPVAVPAVAGDTISLTVERSGAAALVFRSTVPIRKPPVIVRTAPEKNKRDVPLNLRIQVVFSEPIDPASLTPQNFELRSASTTIAGQLSFANAAHTTVEFTPVTDLTGATEYELVLRSGIRDTDGTPLEAPTSIAFTTANPAPAVPGELVVSTATTGVELAPAGYDVSIDGDPLQPIGVNGSMTVGALPPGSHTVKLSGLGANCSVLGTNPRLASVASGASVTVGFAVTCLTTLVTQLAFVRDGQIYLVNSDGTGVVQLTKTGAGVSNYDPTWSPDGRRLAFTRGGGASSDIYVMDADGSNLVQLTSGGFNWEPAWAPDGRTIAFSSVQSGSTGIFVVAADGGQGSRVLLNRPGYDAHPAWSPDGRKLTFTSDWRAYDFVYDLYVMNADGSNVLPLLEGPFFGPATYYFQSAWSPDGQQIAVVVCGYGWANCSSNAPDAPQGFPQSYSAIAVMNADGSGLHVIAQAEGYASPTWSPDGRTIAFGSSNCSGSQPCLRFVRVDGSAEGLILANGHSPAWRP